ncbi:MAG TPA: universal stress protein [Opitutaceae bacterium]|nr:universal stress protein [Opitutaceae bacterium]
MTIVALIDFSAVTDRVFETASSLAGSLKDRVVLLHVVQPSQITTAASAAVEAVQAAVQAAEKAAAQRLARYEKRLQLDGVTVTTVMLRGVPAPQIAEQSVKLGAAFLVLGAQGQNPSTARLLGSTAEGVLRAVRCPVIVVPHPKLGRSRQPWA